MNHSTAAYFGKGYYTLYRNILLPREQTEAEVEFILERVRPQAGQRWLDLPCAYGRHLFSLAQLEPRLELHGADLNCTYLMEPGLEQLATRVCCSMQKLPYADRCFDVILNLLNSFGYDPPCEAGPSGRSQPFIGILAEFNRVLGAGGWLVLDLPNRRPMIQLIREQPYIHYSVDHMEAAETFSWDVARESIFNTTEWKWPGGEETGHYTLRLFTPGQIRDLLDRCGFRIRQLNGDFSGSDFSPWNSDRMLIFAQKQS
jgi:SAM-dependent methyltransferase